MIKIYGIKFTYIFGTSVTIINFGLMIIVEDLILILFLDLVCINEFFKDFKGFLNLIYNTRHQHEIISDHFYDFDIVIYLKIMIISIFSKHS